jgi:phosphatidylserine decarboxylase
MAGNTPPLKKIRIYNRRTKTIQFEQVPGEKLLHRIYSRPWGCRMASWFWSQPFFSRMYGWPMHRRFSRKQIQRFIAEYQIDMSEVAVPDQGFRSFNDFFIRRLRPGARPVSGDPKALVSPADSRMKVFPMRKETILDIKGHTLTLAKLLDSNAAPDFFSDGICLQFRLAPQDYHRFGYCVDGVQGPVHPVGGRLYSVSPLALRHMPAIWGDNYRHWCFVHSPALGTLLQIEIGATVVGSIIQHSPSGRLCQRGREKGYFQMGGSTVLLVVPPGCVAIDDDIQSCSDQGIETLVSYGEAIGRYLRWPV